MRHPLRRSRRETVPNRPDTLHPDDQELIDWARALKTGDLDIPVLGQLTIDGGDDAA